MENNFCFLKGVVDCHSGVIQNCNNMRTTKCPLEEEKESQKRQNFCFLKGLVDCSAGCVLDCNNKRVESCPKE